MVLTAMLEGYVYDPGLLDNSKHIKIPVTDSENLLEIIKSAGCFTLGTNTSTSHLVNYRAVLKPFRRLG